MITCINTEKAFDQAHLFTTKNFNKVGIEKHSCTHSKVIYGNLTVNTILNGERLKVFSLN